MKRLFAVAVVMALPLLAVGQPTQQEVFQSIQTNVGESGEASQLVALLACLAGVVILVAWLVARRRREARPQRVKHAGRLVKEVAKRCQLTPAELRTLRQLAQVKQVSSPLLLLLCPSLLDEAVAEHKSRPKPEVVARLKTKATIVR